MIKAILKNGTIQPLEPLPTGWLDGQELLVEEGETAPDAGEAAEWEQEVEEAAQRIPREEHERFLRALTDIELESKDAVRREWGK